MGWRGHALPFYKAGKEGGDSYGTYRQVGNRGGRSALLVSQGKVGGGGGGRLIGGAEAR